MRAFLVIAVALLVTACGDDDPTEPTTPTLQPGHVWIVSGDGQEGPVGAIAPEPVGIAVEAQNGDRIPGIAVTFEVITENAEVESPVVTDQRGLALAEVRFGDEPGLVAVLASLEGIASPPPLTMTATPE